MTHQTNTLNLLFEEKLKDIPRLMSQNGSRNPIIYMRFWHPLTNWTWHITECNQKTGRCYGYIKALENEWGYFYLSELIDNGAYWDGDFKPISFNEYFKK